MTGQLFTTDRRTPQAEPACPGAMPPLDDPLKLILPLGAVAEAVEAAAQ
jgi:hypothetical protein